MNAVQLARTIDDLIAIAIREHGAVVRTFSTTQGHSALPEASLYGGPDIQCSACGAINAAEYASAELSADRRPSMVSRSIRVNPDGTWDEL